MDDSNNKSEKLLTAIENNDIAKVKELVESGAKVNYQSPKSYDLLGKYHGGVITVGRALMGSAWDAGPSGQEHTGLNVFLDMFGNIEGSTPLMHAVMTGYNSWKSNPNQIQHGNLEIIEYLIQKGADVNTVASNNDNIYPLCLAAMDCNAKIIKTLLDNGALIKPPGCKKKPKVRTIYQRCADYVHLDVFYLDDKKTSAFDLIEQAYEKEGVKGDGCFIATAAYEDPNHPNILLFRTVRDKVLLKNRIGIIFIKIYYKVSPGIAKVITNKKKLKVIVRYVLNMIASLMDRRR